MKKLSINVVLITILFSCSKNLKDFESSNETTPSSIENLNIQTNNFIEIDSTGILLFPLEKGENKREDESYGYKEMPNNNFWNVLFLNTKTNEYNLLTENKILILDYNYKYGNEEDMNIAPKTNHIFYDARSLDHNNDQLIDDKDPIYLFVSDKFGKNFRQISPNNYSISNWQYIQINNKVIMTATKDSDGNELFDEKDEISTFEIILDENEKPKEVFKDDLKNKLKTLYDRDWKRIK